MPEPFQVVVVAAGDVPTLVLRGELDAATAPVLERAIAEVLDGQAVVDRLVVDLAGLGFIDSSGLNVLVATANRLRRAPGIGASLVVVNASPSARRLFAIAGVDRIVEVRESGSGIDG